MTTQLDIAEILLRILEKSMTKPINRKPFKKSDQIETLKIQNKKCNICGKKLDVCDFDHIDGDSSNNNFSNCQALCLECHRKKTRGIKKKGMKLSQIIRSLRSLLKE